MLNGFRYAKQALDVAVGRDGRDHYCSQLDRLELSFVRTVMGVSLALHDQVVYVARLFLKVNDRCRSGSALLIVVVSVSAELHAQHTAVVFAWATIPGMIYIYI